jgi:hypothetical protein
MHLTPKLAGCLGLGLFLSAALAADWAGSLKNAAGALGGTPDKPAIAGGPGKAATGLSDGDMVGGLKDALAVGAERAIKGLGKAGGFLHDQAVRIPLPGPLAKAEGALRMLGQGKLVDEFAATLNTAAEQAVPKAAPIVGNAIRDMSVADAKSLVTGPDDAATRYFKTKTAGPLASAFLPIVKSTTDGAGVTSAFKKLTSKAGPVAGQLGSSADIDRYITEKTLDGLFVKLAAEEKSIRQNPAARSTDLLKKVFGR